jgi:hypothetical protein
VNPRASVAAARLYADVIAPLVLGGQVRTGRPIGGELAVVLADHASAVDVDLRSRTNLGRARIARALLAIDILPEASATDWILLACVHDWLTAASPELPSVLSPRAGDRVLDLTAGTLNYVAVPANAHEALSRHTYLARLLELERKDVRVSFWAGSRLFLGAKPPPRLLAWPDVRRVRTETLPRALATLADHGGKVDKERWRALLDRILRLSPLTDIATMARETPTFGWTAESLGLVATHAGRTLALRALAGIDDESLLTTLGRSSRLLLSGEAWRALGLVMELLGEIVLRIALQSSVGVWSRLAAGAEHSRDLFVGITLGALAAAKTAETSLAATDRQVALTRLLPIARSPEAQNLLPASP